MRKLAREERNTIPRVMSFFSLGSPLEIKAIAEGISNHNYLVRTVANEYFVKFVVNQSINGIINEIAIQKQLQADEILTPIYLRNPDGAYIFLHNDLKVVVSEKIDGIIPRKVNRGLASSMGKTLAKFHASVRQLPHHVEFWMHFETSRIVSAYIEEFNGTELPSGVIYGDMHRGNIHVLPDKEDQVHAIMDLEDAGVDLFLIDVAIALIGTCFSEDDNKPEFDLVETELAGYESVRCLTRAEKRLLPFAVCYAANMITEWLTENGHEEYVGSHKAFAQSFVSPFEV